MNEDLVFLDPGHGSGHADGSLGCPGYDPGATFGNVTEASRALDMALTVKALLPARFAAKLTHDGNQGAKPDLSLRLSRASKAGADMFVSFHFDTSLLTQHTQGVYYAPGAASLTLANMIAKRMHAAQPTWKKPWVKPSSSSRFNGLYIDAFPDALPSVLVEVDSVRFAPPRGPLGKTARVALAQPIVDAIVDYLT